MARERIASLCRKVLDALPDPEVRGASMDSVTVDRAAFMLEDRAASLLEGLS
jgi:hypothetical protein